MGTEAELLAQAREGDENAFAVLARPLMPSLRSYVARMIAVAGDAEDIVQDALLKAHQSLESFRGDASFKNWVFTIATRLCLDHLRRSKRWRTDANQHAQRAAADPEIFGQIMEALGSPESSFSVHEHIAFCFSCVARSLDPQLHAILVLREVVGLSNGEAAKVVGVSESVLRHRLREARGVMQERYEGLCTLVAKGGACLQCAQLAESRAKMTGETPPAVPAIEGDDAEARLTVRLRIVRDARATTFESGLHQVLASLIDRTEREAG